MLQAPATGAAKKIYIYTPAKGAATKAPETGTARRGHLRRVPLARHPRQVPLRRAPATGAASGLATRDGCHPRGGHPSLTRHSTGSAGSNWRCCRCRNRCCLQEQTKKKKKKKKLTNLLIQHAPSGGATQGCHTRQGDHPRGSHPPGGHLRVSHLPGRPPTGVTPARGHPRVQHPPGGHPRV